MRSPKTLLLLAAVVGPAASAARADVTLHPLFTSNMVLQQGVAAPVYGKADPGEAVSFTLTGPDGTASASKQPVVAKADGSWSFALPADLKAGTGYALTVKGKNAVELKNVAVGEVWVCSGQSNMEMAVNGSETPDKVKAASKNPKIRLFTVAKKTSPTPLDDYKDLSHLKGWVECGPETVGSFSAVGYHFGAYLQKHLPGDVPVGLIHTSWGGTPAEAWTSKEALDAVPSLKHYNENLAKKLQDHDPAKADAAFKAATEKWKETSAKLKADGKPVPRAPQKPGDPNLSQNSPARLYNAMLHPLLGYPVKGATWYQGESNAGRAFEYRTLLPTMIQDWRNKWHAELPFMVVQLAPYLAISKEPQDSSWAELREAQYLATKALPKVGLSVITDVGDEKDIHPKPKQPVGERLAVAALAIEYGQKVEPIGPVYKAMAVEGDKAVLTFDHTGGGLAAKGDKLTGFVVAGEDKKFHNADAEIKGDTVVVSSKDVPKPVAVRFGWANYPVVNLWGKSGLPAVPFRTDDFPMVTGPKAAPPAAPKAKAAASAK